MQTFAFEGSDMTTDTEHLRALELLPWRSTDRLERDDFEYVQSAIETSATVHEEARQTDTLFAVLRDDVPVPMLTHERMRRVMARVDAEPQDARPFFLVVKRWWKQLRSSGKPFYLRTALPRCVGSELSRGCRVEHHAAIGTRRRRLHDAV